MARNPPVLTQRPASRPDEVDRLRQRVDDLRAAAGRDVREFQGRLRETFDVRRQVARHPVFAIAVVLGGMFLAATAVRLLRGARTPAAERARRKRAARSHDLTQGPTGEPGTRGGRLKEASG